MKYAKIKPVDIANGTGVRTTIFVSGCTHHCKGCFNPETWDFNYGEEFTQETIEEIVKLAEPDYIAGVTFLGGEPMEPPNQKALLPLAKTLKEKYPEKNIWCFTGYLFDEDIMGRMWKESEVTRQLVPLLDVIVDGEFKEELKDLRLKFKGSSNQRTIDVQESLKNKNITLLFE